MINPKRTPKHYTLRISLTSLCNLNCEYCNPVRKVDPSKIMSDKDFFEIIESAVYVGIEKIAWTGGEPTIRPNFVGIVKKAKELGINDQRLTTNGVLFHRLAKQLKKSGLNQVDISLDTLDREEFKKICKVDAFENVIKSIHTAVELFPVTKINSVFFKSNFHTLDDFVSFIESFKGKLSLRINEIVPCGEIYDKDPTLFDREFLPVYQILFKFAQMGKLTPVNNKWDMVKSLYFKIAGKKGIYGVLPNPSINYKCDEEDCTKIRVSPHGFVSNCTIQMGYLRDFNHTTLEEKKKLMKEIVAEKMNRDYRGFKHKQKYYDFWRFGIDTGLESIIENARKRTLLSFKK